MRRQPRKQIVMNGTLRPVGMWRIAGMGPFEWMLSHRPFFRMMGYEGLFNSIYTPKMRRARRKPIPGLDRPRYAALDDMLPF